MKQEIDWEAISEKEYQAYTQRLEIVELILDDARPRGMQREAAQFIKEEVRRLDSRMRAFLPLRARR